MRPRTARWLVVGLAIGLGLALPAPTAQPPADKPAALPALSIKGTRLVDPAGKTVLLRGVNLGSWLLLESHFSGFAFRDEKSLWPGLSAASAGPR